MRLLLIAFCLLFAAAGSISAKTPAAGEETAYGKLTVYSDLPGSDIYVDVKFVGQDRATISNIPAGKHYVRVVKDDKTLQSGLVDVREGEETIIVAKQSEEELLSRIKKPNHVMIFGGLTAVGYNETNPNGTYNLTYRPQYGVGTEVKFAVPVIDVNVDLGYFLNYPAALVLSSTAEAQVAISSPYISVSKDLWRNGALKVSAGGGFNYGIFSPGGGTSVSISSRIGYLAYLEGMRNLGENQKLTIKAGYIIYNGKTTVAGGTGDVSCAGLFILTGIAYQL